MGLPGAVLGAFARRVRTHAMYIQSELAHDHDGKLSLGIRESVGRLIICHELADELCCSQQGNECKRASKAPAGQRECPSTAPR
jgi:hypothetical protein